MSFDLGVFCYPDASSETKSCVNWRTTPGKSLSDWTLTITSKAIPAGGKEENRVHAYHVHKTYLAIGPRSSVYFEHLFQENNSSTTTTTPTNNTTNLEFEASSADAMPAMLDFMYSATEDVKATSANAVALRHLAHYFGIPELFANVNTFVQSDLSPITSPIYLSESAIYYDEQIMNASFQLCVMNFESLEEHSLAALSPKLFRKVVLSPDFSCESQSLSIRVAAFWRAHSGLDSCLLKELTNQAILPDIHPKEALFFLQVALDHNLHVNAPALVVVHNQQAEDVVETEVHTSLQTRSIVAASTHWDGTLVENVGLNGMHHHHHHQQPVSPDVSRYDQLPDKIRTELLEAALVCASKETRTLRNELRQFIRVPTDHKFDQYGYISYFVTGDETWTRPPSAMPSLSDPTLDGYLYHSGNHVWPVFYYQASS